MTPEEIKEFVDESAKTLFRAPDGWPSMERHDRPGSPRNIVFLGVQNVNKDLRTSEELIEAMRASFKAEVFRIIGRVTGVRIE